MCRDATAAGEVPKADDARNFFCRRGVLVFPEKTRGGGGGGQERREERGRARHHRPGRSKVEGRRGDKEKKTYQTSDRWRRGG